MMKSSTKNKSFDVPPNLATRCMRLHGWSECYAGKAVEGYLQFIEMKKRHEDWDASILAPSLAVNLVWRQHILDPVHYAESCVNFVGRVIGHNPDDKLDQSGREERIKSTKIALRGFFGCAFDNEVWSFGFEVESDAVVWTFVDDYVDSEPRSLVDEATGGVVSEGWSFVDGLKAHRSTATRGKQLVATDDLNRVGTVNIRPKILGENVSARNKLDSPKDGSRTSRDSTRLFTTNAGKKLVSSDENTAPTVSLDSKDNGTSSNAGKNPALPQVCKPSHKNNKPLEDSNALVIRVKSSSGKECRVRAKRSTRMKKIFDAYAKRQGVEATSLRFLLDGERVSPTDTPEMWALEDQYCLHVLRIGTES